MLTSTFVALIAVCRHCIVTVSMLQIDLLALAQSTDTVVRRDMSHVVTLIERHDLFSSVLDKLRLVAEADPSRAIPLFVTHIDKVLAHFIPICNA